MLPQILKIFSEMLVTKSVTLTISVFLVVFVWQTIFLHNATESLRNNVLHVSGAQVLDVAIQPASLYKGYMKKFNKNYGKEETEKRFQLFKESLKEISRLNQETGAIHGLTKFSDMYEHEVLPPNTFWPNLRDCKSLTKSCEEDDDDDNVLNNIHLQGELPDRFDWRDYPGVVGPVLDQKLCNGCWAFGIAGAMESMAAIQKIERDVRLSIQELIDCSSDYTKGCDGGHVANALSWMCDDHVGVVSDEEYPLVLVTGNCSRTHPPWWKVKTYTTQCDVSVGDLLRRIVSHGPVMTAVNAKPWLFYTGGVIQRACFRSHDGVTMDHLVQIVGYDRTAEVPHYIIRNSWGDDFGVEGYVKLALEGNVCGVRDEITYLKVYKSNE